MTYSVPLGPGAAGGADYTASPAHDDSPFASPYATETADSADAAQAGPSSTGHDVARPYDPDEVGRAADTDHFHPYGAEAGTSTDHVDDLGDADMSYNDSDGSFHAGYDTDGDGRLDRLLVDEDGDGRIDVYSYDRNGDGRVDLELRDTNHDGHID
jgi:hypothetical protein